MSPTLFITGGSRGIGAAIVIHAAQAGWNVAFSYVSNETAAHQVIRHAVDGAPHQKVQAYALDVRNSAQVDEVADRVLADFGRVQAVVCNAGVSLNGLAFSTTDEDWDTVIDTNLSGSFRVCRAFLPEFVAHREGRIVMMSSIAAEGASGQAAYAASKAGLIGLAKTLAKEYGPKGITSNVLVPGYFDTDMTRQGMPDKVQNYAVEYCPLRRLGTLSELAKTTLFLLSEGAGFINGDVIKVTGGLGWAP